MNENASVESLSRRRLLVVATGSVALAACGPVMMTGDASSDGSLDTDGDSAVDDTTSGTDAGDDAGPATDSGPGCSTTPPGTHVGTVANFAVGTLVAHTTPALIIGQDAGGLYAFSAVCTHQGCSVRVSGAGVRCPCHGATFDVNGQTPTRPATRPLVHYALALCGSDVYVDTSMTVPAATRTPAA